MARSGSVELYKIGIAVFITGIALMLFSLLENYLQNEKVDGGLIAAMAMIAITGAFLYIKGKKSKSQDK